MDTPLRYLVQDIETRQFLVEGESGDIDFTPWVDEAGVFSDREIANECALEHCGGEGFIVFRFCVASEDVECMH